MTLNDISSCSCGKFFQYRGPCSHTIAACQYEVEDYFIYFDTKYYVQKYKRTYEIPLAPLDIENLCSDGLDPPKIVKQC